MGINKHTQRAIDFIQPECLTDWSKIKDWAGGVLDWILCEIIIHVTYMFTFIILMIKSRFGPVGVDNTQQFQSTYMGFLADKIVSKIPFFGTNKKRMKPFDQVKR